MNKLRSVETLGSRIGMAGGVLALFAWAAVGMTTMAAATTTPVAPVVEGRWVRPAEASEERWERLPLWGHAEGLQVGLAHAGLGPRGLLRVYAPYLGNPAGRVINYIAVEPVLRGEKQRGFSELERSGLDGVAGKRFWSVADPAEREPRSALEPVRGEIVEIDGVECLRVWIQVEPFANGARVYVRLVFRADRPHEVALAAFAHEDSKPLGHCILTATMGNYARLRNLRLAANETVSSLELWPDHRGNGFTPHATFPLSRLKRNAEGHAVVSATPDETDPAAARYAPETRPHWRYAGRVATQTWRCEDPDPALQVFVNGRYVYWNSQSPIPGGVSFENFEMVSPFRQGQEFIFAVEPVVASDE